MNCPKDLHEMTPENTYTDPTGRVWCRACMAVRVRKSHLKTGRKRAPRESDTGNVEVRAMDLALAANPPVIEWAKNRRGVFEAVYVHDPHAETTAEARVERERAAEVRAGLLFLDDLKQEADEVAERLRKHRADNTPLLAAARTQI